MKSMKMNPNQHLTLDMNSGEKASASAAKPYLTLNLSEDLTEKSSTTFWSHDLRISDNSHSDSNPGQRKKGGCKQVSLNVVVAGRTFAIPAKCDVRKSFSNRSFAQYYDRSAYAVIPLDSQDGLYMTVSEATKGRDGKFFVAMEKSRCSIDQRPSNTRHPLLAFASEAVYRVVIHSTNDQHISSSISLEAKCLFQQGSASVVSHRQSTSSKSKVSREIKREREVKVKVEPVESPPQPVMSRVSFTPSAPSMVYYSAPQSTYSTSQAQVHSGPVHHPYNNYGVAQYSYHVPSPTMGPVRSSVESPFSLPEVPITNQVQQSINQSIKIETIDRAQSVLGKRQRHEDTDAWFESKHLCFDNNILPTHFFPSTIALDQEHHIDLVPHHKLEPAESSNELDMFDQISGGCSPTLSLFSSDSDDCFSPSSPFTDSLSDFSGSEEYDSLFQHTEPMPLASPLAMPHPSPSIFSNPFHNWEHYHLNEFSLQ